MPTVHYYGKKHTLVGKTLFEILANLRNFGLNRMLIKHEELLKYPGKRSYYIVKKVEPVMDSQLQEGAIYAERIFKGTKFPSLVFVDEESWHTDWQLIPKHEESRYVFENPPTYMEPQVESKSFTCPPLMDKYLKRHFNKTESEPMTIKLNYKPREVEFDIDVSKPMKSLLRDRFRNQ